MSGIDCIAEADWIEGRADDGDKAAAGVGDNTVQLVDTAILPLPNGELDGGGSAHS